MLRIIMLLTFCSAVCLNAFASNIGFLKYGVLAHYSENDIQLLQKEYIYALKNNKPGDVLNWKNAETKHGGKITVIKQFKQAENVCKRLMFKSISKQQPGVVYFNFCLIDQKWNVVP